MRLRVEREREARRQWGEAGPARRRARIRNTVLGVSLAIGLGVVVFLFVPLGEYSAGGALGAVAFVLVTLRFVARVARRLEGVD